MISFVGYEPVDHVPVTRHVEDTPDADYRFRVSMPRAVFTGTVAEITANVNYPNFKDECESRGAGRVWLGALHKIWSILASFQDHTASRRSG